MSLLHNEARFRSEVTNLLRWSLIDCFRLLFVIRTAPVEADNDFASAMMIHLKPAQSCCLKVVPPEIFVFEILPDFMVYGTQNSCPMIE